MKQVEKIFEKVDFIATPTTATGTVRVDANDYQCKFFVSFFRIIINIKSAVWMSGTVWVIQSFVNSQISQVDTC